MPSLDGSGNLTARTATNAVINVTGAGWGAVLGVIQVPVIIHALGAEVYGVYVLITVVAGYLGLLELNLSAALVKYVAEYAGRSDRARVEDVIRTTMALYIALGVCAAVVFLTGGRALMPFLNIPPSATAAALRALTVTALALPFTFVSGTLAMVPAAVGRFDVSVALSAAISTIATAASIAVALLGGKLVALALVNGITGVVAVVASVGVGKRIFPGVSFWPRWNRTRAGALLRFSAFSFLGKLSGTVVATVDRVAIGIILGPAAVAYYTVPSGLIRRISGFLNRMAYVVLPVASELTGRLEFDRLQRAYVRGARITWTIALLVGVGLAIFAHPLLRIWVGSDFAQRGTAVMQFLALAFVITTASNVPALITEGMGHPKVTGAFSTGSMIINLALLVPALRMFGIPGVAAVWLAATTSMTLPFIHYAQRRLLHLPWRYTVQHIYLPSVAMIRADLRDVTGILLGRLSQHP